MSEPNAQSNAADFVLDDPIEPLDASSLNTVLAMLEVIDSLDDLALLETLTPAQKRQVWNATPEATRIRLVELRASAQVATRSTESIPAQDVAASITQDASPVSPDSPSSIDAAISPLIDSTDLLEDWTGTNEETAIEETAIDAADLAEIDLSLSSLNSLNLTAQPKINPGDWVVLQAKPQLSRAELNAIWQVLEVHQDTVRISTERLGTRTYPIAWMIVYPKPAEPEPDF